MSNARDWIACSKWQSLLQLKYGNQYEVVLIMVAEIEVAAALFYLLDLFQDHFILHQKLLLVSISDAKWNYLNYNLLCIWHSW